MAVDRNRAKELIDGINASFEAVTGALPDAARRWLRDRVLGAAVGEIEKLVTESRPPVLYVLGRSGHGKSSLINALARRKVAEVDDIRPRTAVAVPYTIRFEEVFAEWQVYDSRGIFDTTAPEGAAGVDAVEQLLADVAEFRPDVILHVVAAPEARTLSNDFAVLDRVQARLARETGTAAPALMVLTKVDVLGDPRAWPLEAHPGKAGLVKQLLDYVARDVLGATPDRLDRNDGLAGYAIASGGYIGVVPVCARQDDEWNLEHLADFIGRHIPESALLDYCQGLQRREQLRRVSTAVTRRFATTASGVGAAPVPIADIAVLTPLQLLLVAFIAGLSCRPFSLQTAREYMGAAGLNVGAAFGARETVRALARVVPTVGSIASGAIAGATTYGIGRAAEAYFFAGERRKPSSFIGEWVGTRAKRRGDQALLG
jgi:uncharacterized protein (DUF697 family)